MRPGDVIAIFCPRCDRVTDSQARVCDVELGGQLVIDNILCTVCRKCQKITSLAARDAVEVTGRPRLSAEDRQSMDQVLGMIHGAPAAPQLSPPGPKRSPLGQVFYAGLGLGTVLAGVAFSYPEYALPSFLSFAVATGLYSTMLGRLNRG